MRYIEGETHCTYMGTVRPQPGSESISVNLLRGNCAAGVDRCGSWCVLPLQCSKPSALFNQYAVKSDFR